MSAIAYLNLTNGIEALRYTASPQRFIRIQSTACEQKRWDFILQDLDYDFLLSLALGRRCAIYDFGHTGTPRALWQGVEWIKYALTRNWLKAEYKPIVRGHNASGYFADQYANLEARTLSKLKYFRKFVQTETIDLEVIAAPTTHDGQYAYYAELLCAKG